MVMWSKVDQKESDKFIRLPGSGCVCPSSNCKDLKLELHLAKIQVQRSYVGKVAVNQRDDIGSGSHNDVSKGLDPLLLGMQSDDFFRAQAKAVHAMNTVACLGLCFRLG